MNHKNKRKFLMGVVVLNVVLLIFGAVLVLGGNQDDITLYDIPLHTAAGEYTDGEQNMFSTNYPEAYYYFIAETGSLETGIYDITVDYDTHMYHDYYTITCSYAEDGRYYPAVYAEPHDLSSFNQSLTYHIWVNSKLDNLKLRINCGTRSGEIFELWQGSSFYVDKIQVSRDYRLTVLYKGLKLLLFLLLVDSGLLLYWNRARIGSWLRDNFYVIFGLACVFMASSLCVFGKFSVGHHDIPFHYTRIIGLAEGLLSGSFPVKIQPGWLWGYGYAASVCYGDLLLYIPAVLYIMGVPVVHAYKTYILMCNLGTVFTSYFCYRKISGNQYVGVTCTALYCLSITRLLNIYLRTAVGEYTAFMFLPLVLLGVWQIYKEESKSFQNSGMLLCLGMTGVIQSHVISTEMSCIFIALTVLLLIRRMSWRIFAAFARTVLIALCLNLGFLLPLLDYSTDALNVFSHRRAYGIQQAGLSLYELFSIGSTGMGEWQDALLGLSGRIPESLGAAMLIVLLLTVTVAFKCYDWKGGGKREFITAVILSGTALWMATYYFPYNRLAAVPGLKNVFASIQFPWRFLSIAVPLLVYLAGHVLVKVGQMYGRKMLHRVLIVICLVSAVQGLYCMDLLNRSEDMSQVYYDYRDNRNHGWIASSGEYLLKGTDTYQLGLEQDIVGENVQLGVPEREGTQIQVSCQAEENARVTFPLFAYKYYQCMDLQTGEHFPIVRGDNNRIQVDLQDHYRGTLKVCFVEPWHWRAAETVSLLTLLWLIGYVWRRRRHCAEPVWEGGRSLID
ncbi:MAG: hypothetical protein NC489_23525 [Ruminococcus flavefaciens]|nr:hypothetical protein [Ruminococcus flavefaciens]